ncbi:MAG: sigma 54-interacting transcriptional regulator [Deltaproteobacteria bacterium]|jgi:transcriptional regulator with PAS, ATPase and Fis domain|nr:sigma 54-interacting transcriptional regulator [Deltaproteobacteria bacterium]
MSYDFLDNPIFQMIRRGIDCFQGNLLVADGNGDILFVNDYLCRLYDLSFEQALTMNIYDLVRLGIIDKSAAVGAFETKKVCFRRLTTRTGVKLDSVGYPVLDENGDLYCVSGYSYDGLFLQEIVDQIITEQKNNEKIMKTIKYLSSNEAKNNIFSDDKMIKIYEMAKKIAPSDSTVIIYGESGTGKEVMANFIHNNSNRSNKVFMPVNCGAIPNELMESEFFGYDKGAFTGASHEGRIGIFEMADKGTVFLDEIGDLPLSTQAKLLRVLETGEVKRVGGSQRFFVNVRVIAATNKNLKEMVGSGLFREDLFYRLDVLPFNLPPLRERPKDIEVMAEMFMEEFNKKYGSKIKLDPKTLAKFKAYSWPGNVRELRNEIERMAICSDNSTGLFSQYSDFFDNHDSVCKNSQRTNDDQVSLKNLMNNYEVDIIKAALKRTNGRVLQAAKELGIHRTMMYKKMRKYGL